MSILLSEEKVAAGSATFQNILVAVDPGGDAPRLLALAAALGRKFQAKVSLLHVVPDHDLHLDDPRGARHLARGTNAACWSVRS